MRKFILMFILLLISTISICQNESRKRFIDTVFNHLTSNTDSSLIICFKYKDRNNLIKYALCSNYYAFQIMNKYRNYSKEKYKLFMKDVLYRDKVIECNTLFGKLESSKDSDIEAFERLTTEIKNNKFKIVDSIVNGNKNYIDILFKNTKELKHEYYGFYREIIYTLWNKNIGFINSFLIGYLDGKIINMKNEDYINIYKNNNSIIHKYIYIKDFGIMLYPFPGINAERPYNLVPWKVNDTAYLFGVWRTSDYKGTLTFGITKNNKRYIEGKYKTTNTLYYDKLDSFSHHIVGDRNLDYIPYYVPVKFGIWKYYDDNEKLIKEEDFGN